MTPDERRARDLAPTEAADVVAGLARLGTGSVIAVGRATRLKACDMAAEALRENVRLRWQRDEARWWVEAWRATDTRRRYAWGPLPWEADDE